MQQKATYESSPIKILLIEDNPADVRLTQEAMKAAEFPVELEVKYDGEAALEYLLLSCDESVHLLPDIILLDLNLPKIDGRELLSIIKSDKRLMKIPVIVLSTSESQDDIHKAYNAHCNCYLTKPVGFDEFSDLLDAINRFWLSVVNLPLRCS